ncbi:PhzF family phenazine biosynthesis protein [Thalassotalea euphylliae]|uniref:PhzF family phenazine biosynthesis protein n=1 Tax=Thalassotalea euphylliae TaxID=1655234 RepID=A0A3E0UG10_9GAMM|nr:PhzF family phenazine biosynthesis protein [Thalassotalea euphylliae]REL35829.1 PhzF family phenazine biosynthesis protein [Thalassotalea euphylliae]
MKLTINVVDAFADHQFGGNSAAVIITDSWLSEELMQSIATENNLSETAFLVPEGENSGKQNHYAIRWFSPLMEIDFCGHATLASAWVIFSKNPEFTECSISAPAVGAMLIRQGADGYIDMDFPNRIPTPVSEVPDALLNGLSLAPEKVLKNQQAYIAVYKTEAEVKAVRQDSQLIKQLAPYDVVVTAPSANNLIDDNLPDYDFVSRYFWPANGGDEDPVTGSIHTALAPFWAEQLGKTELIAYQASKRGGILKCQLATNKLTGERVIISGKAVPYLEGIITIYETHQA